MSTSTPDSSEKTRILLVDDHPIVRQGLALLINQEPDLVVCGEASTMREALAVVESAQPQVVIVDISLTDGSGVELIKQLHKLHPQLLCFALSMYDESIYAIRVLRAGGRGYMMKEEVSRNVITAIRQILGGELYLSDRMSSRLVGQLVHGASDVSPPLGQLSDRELEVLTMIGRGMGTRDLAERLFISVKTVEAHKERLKEKLRLNNATELTRFAVQFTLDGARS